MIDFETLMSQHGFGTYASCVPLEGGSCNDAYLLTNTRRENFFIKCQSAEPLPMLYQKEANGLAALSKTETVLTPKVLVVEDDYLVLEYLKDTPVSNKAWEQLGGTLAKLHQIKQPFYGFSEDNYIGLTRQLNPQTSDGFEFYATARYLPQAKLAFDSGLLNQSQVWQCEQIVKRLPQLIPYQTPSLIHGDLWSGNVCKTEHDSIYLIDPACYYGFAEAEVAMTLIFSSFPPSFYEAYFGAHPFPPGFEDRVEIYNLYHFLNHVNLFGKSYLEQTCMILDRYT